jgi:hypothetical protein
MHIINNASDLLNAMLEGGYTIEVKNGFIEVSPAFAIDDEMAELIKLHKVGLIKLLKANR